MFFEDELTDWSEYSEHEQMLAESAFNVLADEISSDKKPRAFFIKGILLDNFVGYEDASDEFKQAIADEIVHQWEIRHPNTSGKATCQAGLAR